MACTTPFDILRSKVEDLGPQLYVRASYKDPWLNLIPRDSYPRGAGYVRSAFVVGRSEPSSDEESWPAIQSIANNADSGACAVTYNQTYTGFKENTYAPENFGLMGPLVCQDDLTMYWHSQEFWEKYFQALEKRNRKSIINRLSNVYMQYCSKASCNSNFNFLGGDYATQPAPANVDLSNLAGGNVPTSELTQEMLDACATELMEEGADEPNTNGWITQGPDGAVFPLLIGTQMSHRLLLNNSELRSDFNQSFQGWGEANPVIKRLGASRIIKNFRHVVTRFPARWALIASGSTVAIAKDSTGATTMTATVTTANTPPRVTVVYKDGSGNTLSTFGPQNVQAYNTNALVRVPTWVMSTASGDATKGQVSIVNPAWRDPSIASFEAAVVLNPWVFTEEVLMPTNSAPGMKLKPQNYFGEWQFVTGNDALLGINSCAGIQDPMHKQGRHFAEYRHANKPIFPIFGRLVLFSRCVSAFDTITCS